MLRMQAIYAKDAPASFGCIGRHAAMMGVFCKLTSKAGLIRNGGGIEHDAMDTKSESAKSHPGRLETCRMLHKLQLRSISSLFT